MRPVCVNCSVEMRCHKNGQPVVSGNGLYHGDVYECPDCKFRVVSGFSSLPIREGWEPDFREVVEAERMAAGSVLTLVE